ncbi:hypothetical protein [Pontimicrobium aquaticum]|uniref:Lipoprotein n=1 Tax=Pontimicrobium aquaticum TaxID=2565367 RepID=A0A4U0EWG3_9FLAO|nr:hypothetical protein [Pontimicrobium aquaticum]TJY34722.1 hypothetical protein E5167_10460 [Pontimicrobium aquaticum]
MKKIISAIFIFTLIFSCSLDNDIDRDAAYTDIIPIQSAEFPDYFESGQTHTITYNYLRPSTCHSFYDLYYVAEENTRTIAVVAYVEVSDDCEVLTDENVESSFNFRAEEPIGTVYTFKFWQGRDNSGEDIFVTYEVEVQ